MANDQPTILFLYQISEPKAPGVPPKSLDAAMGSCQLEALVPLEQHCACQGIVIGTADQGRVIGLAYHVTDIIPKIASCK